MKLNAKALEHGNVRTLSSIRRTHARPSFLLLGILLLCTPARFFPWTEGVAASAEDPSPTVHSTVTLSNGVEFPLLGLGVGNLNLEDTASVFAMVESAEYVLVDTASGPDSEVLVAKSLNNNDKNGNTNTHVVTKVWYTHLGYERTKLSVTESLLKLKPLNKVHVLIHWPQCYKGVEWMDCQGEEERLPDHVKAAGPSPLLDVENAWKGSWDALVELYEREDRILSIGVSNFEKHHLEYLVADPDKNDNNGKTKVKPHVYQGHVATVFRNHDIMTLLHEHNITFQAYGVMEGVYGNLWDKPVAREHLSRIALKLMRNNDATVTSAQLVLAWLFQNYHTITAVVRSKNEAHLRENASARLLPAMPFEDYRHMSVVLDHVLVKNKDMTTEAPEEEQPELEEVKVRFINKLATQVSQLFWINHETQERVPLLQHHLPPGGNTQLGSYLGHTFEAHDEQGNVFPFEVTGKNIKRGHEVFRIGEEL